MYCLILTWILGIKSSRGLSPRDIFFIEPEEHLTSLDEKYRLLTNIPVDRIYLLGTWCITLQKNLILSDQPLQIDLSKLYKKQFPSLLSSPHITLKYIQHFLKCFIQIKKNITYAGLL